MYSFDSRIRYSEVDSKGTLNWLALMDYFQDCSVFHSGKSAHWSRLSGGSSSGVGTYHPGRYCLNRMPKLADMVTTQTWAYGMKSFYGMP